MYKRQGQDDTNQGNELVKELKDKDVLDLCVVDENQAKQGLQDGEYYATITIPVSYTHLLLKIMFHTMMIQFLQ